MNLTTARSVKRAKEIGVRKVVGAVRSCIDKAIYRRSFTDSNAISNYIALANCYACRYRHSTSLQENKFILPFTIFRISG